MRLRKSWEFQFVKKNGKRKKEQAFWFQLFVTPNSDRLPKLGVIASRRFGGAVQRNRAKRRFREIFRKNSEFFPNGSLIVLLPRPALFSLSFSDTEKRILEAVRKTTIKQ
jgi:ribonuclease P protein component